jgi:hypothetical protein
MNCQSRSGMKFLALTFFGVLAAACSPSRPPEPASAGSQVDEIVAAHLAARGGAERLRALRSIRETGKVTASDGRVALVIREIQRPGLFRLEFDYQGTTSVFAHDGRTRWQVAPLQGQFEPMVLPPEADAEVGVDQRDIEGPLVDWKAKGHVVTLAGREPVDGKEAFKLELALKGGTTRYDYVDVASHQVVRSDVPRLVRGHATMLMNSFSDFRKVGGIVFPHAIETHVKDRPQVLRIAVERIELDPVLDEARFRMPQ